MNKSHKSQKASFTKQGKAALRFSGSTYSADFTTFTQGNNATALFLFLVQWYFRKHREFFQYFEENILIWANTNLSCAYSVSARALADILSQRLSTSPAFLLLYNAVISSKLTTTKCIKTIGSTHRLSLADSSVAF